jgi:hypothetical protein
MTLRVLSLAAFISLLGPSPARSQESIAQRGLYDSGISVAVGTGRYSVRDEYISTERYSGTLPYTEVSWTRFGESRGFKLGVGFRTGGEVKNHRLSTSVTAASLDLEYYYRLGGFRLFGKPASVFMGPSTGITVYTSDQNIASNGLDLTVSFAALFSVGAASGIVLPLSPRLVASTDLRLDLLSIGFRIVDLVENDESPVKVLTGLHATSAVARLGVRYDLHERLNVGLRYEAQMMRISSWDYLGAASDNLILALTLRL